MLRSLLSVLIFALLISSLDNAVFSKRYFDVRDYGAVSDGRTDSSKAFERAWRAACEEEVAKIIVKGTYLVGPTKFKGPCKGVMTIRFEGLLRASTNLNLYEHDWIDFRYIDGLRITGTGKFDGQGPTAWPFNKCSERPKCKPLPMSLVFNFVNNAKIRGISSINSKFFHIKVFASNNISFRRIYIKAPATSPNTDGIHIGNSNNVTIAKSFIGTGDDCVSVGPGSSSIHINNVFCGPGHGISIGSLGKDMRERNVSNIIVRNCTLTNTDNGLRIKSWQSSPKVTTASNFYFENIMMNNVQNPIIIDQKYCPNGFCFEKYPSQVKISNIMFRNIRGTSASPIAINLQCSDAMPCDGIELRNIDLEYRSWQDEVPTLTSCANVRGRSVGINEASLLHLSFYVYRLSVN